MVSPFAVLHPHPHPRTRTDLYLPRYVMTFFSAVLLVLILFFRKKIAIAVGIIKEASSAYPLPSMHSHAHCLGGGG
jgi:hypothetical protein